MLPHAGSFITPPDYKCVGQGVKCQRDAKSKEIWGQTGMTNELYFTNIHPFGNTRMENVNSCSNSGNFLETIAGFRFQVYHLFSIQLGQFLECAQFPCICILPVTYHFLGFIIRKSAGRHGHACFYLILSSIIFEDIFLHLIVDKQEKCFENNQLA